MGLFYDFLYQNNFADNSSVSDNSETFEEIEESQEESQDESQEESQEESVYVSSCSCNGNSVSDVLFTDNMSVCIFLLATILGVCLFNIFRSKL